MLFIQQNPWPSRLSHALQLLSLKWTVMWPSSGRSLERLPPYCLSLSVPLFMLWAASGVKRIPGASRLWGVHPSPLLACSVEFSGFWILLSLPKWANLSYSMCMFWWSICLGWPLCTAVPQKHESFARARARVLSHLLVSSRLIWSSGWDCCTGGRYNSLLTVRLRVPADHADTLWVASVHLCSATAKLHNWANATVRAINKLLINQ